ncbi:MAG: hypothetical protein J7496_01680 [Novosphingobium sp.]|nr:hypothetical protein [Novosphingobium sp.]
MDDGVSFCTSCGRLVAPAAESRGTGFLDLALAEPLPGDVSPADCGSRHLDRRGSSFCRRCGTLYSDFPNFCRECGAAMSVRKDACQAP